MKAVRMARPVAAAVVALTNILPFAFFAFCTFCARAAGASTPADGADATEHTTAAAAGSTNQPNHAREGRGARAAHRETTAHDDPAGRPSDRNDLLEIFVESGAEWIDLGTLRIGRDFIPSTVRSTGWGLSEGVGCALRIFFLTIGPRFRYAHFRDWDLWTLNGEAGWNVTLGRVDARLVLGGGYAKLGHAVGSNLGLEEGVTIQGYDIRVGVGADVRVTKILSVGAMVSGEIMGLIRPEANHQHGLVQDYYNLRSSSVGAAVTSTLAVGLHL